MRTREPDQGRGIHQPHWRETKNAAFHRMESCSSDEDPQPELPDCFRNQAYVEKLVNGLKCEKKGSGEDEADRGHAAATGAPRQEASAPPSAAWQPKTQFRTCLSSLASREQFGPMMAAEADMRGFFAASQQAFLGDGLAYNQSRMDYPCYRRSGLPVTSSLAESLVKQVSQRVKGTEKFWNDGPSGEAILQVRAAVISDDDRLQTWIRNRPVSPFSPRCRFASGAISV